MGAGQEYFYEKFIIKIIWETKLQGINLKNLGKFLKRGSKEREEVLRVIIKVFKKIWIINL